MFRIRMLRVAQGDCLWIDYGKGSETHHVLIDGGPSANSSLMKEIGKEVEKSGKLHFELLVVTHIDNDHIVGVINLLEALPAAVTIGEIWFNTYQHLLASDRLGGVDLGDEVSRVLSRQSSDFTVALSAPDMLGAKEGEDLASLLGRRFADKWNARFPLGRPGKRPRDRPLYMSDDGALPTIVLEGGAVLTLLSPGKEQLSELAAEWRRILKEKKIKPGSGLGDRLGRKDVWPPNVVQLSKRKPKLDTSENNGSSIAFLLEYKGDNVAVLFGADAFAPVMQANIERLVRERSMPKLRLDAFKLSHHGSRANITNDLLALLECRNYLISTDGTNHSHPDHEALSRILVHGGKEPHLWFNALAKTTRDWGKGKHPKEWPAFVAHFPSDAENDRGIDIGLPMPR